MKLEVNAVRAILASAVFVSASALGAGFADCPQFFANGHPPVIKGEKLRELCYSHFAVLHSGQTRTPLFAAERLTAAEVAASAKEARSNRFFADARVPGAERAELQDYEGSGFDRGHMAPAGDQPDDTAMAQSFSLANMVPQDPHNNRGPWASFEKSVRKYVAKAEGPVYVISGPVFEGASRKLNGRVAVPAHLFKLVYDKAGNRAWAYWIANTRDARATRPITYAELTKRLGVELLPGLRPGF